MDVNEVDYIKIGQRIRAARLKLGWQQAEVAFRAGLTTSHMSHIETGQTKVALPTIVKIANTLSVSVDELLCDSLEQVKPVYDKKIADELADCDAAELQAMLEIIHTRRHSVPSASKTSAPALPRSHKRIAALGVWQAPFSVCSILPNIFATFAHSGLAG